MNVRRATPADAERLYALLRDAFGTTYLEWTIFRSPKSVAYLRSLIADPEHSGHEIFVNEDGFYDAIRTPDALFLNYIASVRRGGGNALLAHFEDRARELGHHAVALDVFATNSVARPWYVRHGYVNVSSTWQAMIDVDSIPKSAPLHYDEAAFRAALEEEATRGFSKIDCGTVDAGLIGGDIVKLLTLRGVTPIEGASAVAATFARERLIVPSLPSAPTAWPGARIEQSIRMRKELRR